MRRSDFSRPESLSSAPRFPFRPTAPEAARSPKVPGRPLCACHEPGTPSVQRFLGLRGEPLRCVRAAVAFHQAGGLGTDDLGLFRGVPRGLRTRCLRFAAALAGRPRKTRSPAAVLGLTGTGLSPVGRYERFLLATSASSSPRLHLAQRPEGRGTPRDSRRVQARLRRALARAPSSTSATRARRQAGLDGSAGCLRGAPAF